MSRLDTLERPQPIGVAGVPRAKDFRKARVERGRTRDSAVSSRRKFVFWRTVHP